ncbi:Hypothetical_protein [Hexamita inflata]|uniref:Hypothetical_protein n=1 Tax=Hexamita inflata TaxID=28002 RepID=A0AA86QN21_9EUKA|nr:Hypothetical protein HINF_LOCUS50359 [Hexamita inflata]
MSSCIIIYITRSIFRNLKNSNIVHRICHSRIKHSSVLNCSSFRNTDPSHHLNTVNMKEVQNILTLDQTSRFTPNPLQTTYSVYSIRIDGILYITCFQLKQEHNNGHIIYIYLQSTVSLGAEFHKQNLEK